MRCKYLTMAAIFIPVVIIVAAAGGTFTALRLEENDWFCAACHTQPELKYYQQTLANQPATLAAFHAHTPQQTARCIDCHSGAGTFGRAVGLEQGAHDLASYLIGRYHSPAITTAPLTDASCVKCHANIVPDHVVKNAKSLTDHYHEYLPFWKQIDPRGVARCADCHTSHTGGLAGEQFMNNGAASAVCDRCHRELSGLIE